MYVNIAYQYVYTFIRQYKLIGLILLSFYADYTLLT